MVIGIEELERKNEYLFLITEATVRLVIYNRSLARSVRIAYGSVQIGAGARRPREGVQRAGVPGGRGWDSERDVEALRPGLVHEDGDKDWGCFSFIFARFLLLFLFHFLFLSFLMLLFFLFFVFFVFFFSSPCFSFYFSFFFLWLLFCSLSLSLSLSRSVSLRLLFFLLRLYTLLVVSSVPSASSLQTRRQSKLKARLGCEWGQHPERVSIPGRNNRDCAYQASIIPPSPDFNVGARATMHWGKKDS